jgi:hypothetical protein
VSSGTSCRSPSLSLLEIGNSDVVVHCGGAVAEDTLQLSLSDVRSG